MVHFSRYISAAFIVLFYVTYANSKPAGQKKQLENSSAKIAAEQLDKLREQKGNTIVQTAEEHISIENGKKTETKQKEEIIKDGKGKLLSDLKQQIKSAQNGDNRPSGVMETDIDIPERNFHKSFVKIAGDEQAKMKKSSNEMRNQRLKIEFNPLELAKYIDETGDEEGIVLAINELMDDGMLTREQALEYLERIKLALEMMRTSEEQHGNALNEIRRPNKEREMSEDYQMRSSEYTPTAEEQELLSKLQVADYLYRGYEMEVIYQLFRDLFKKKLTEGDVKNVQITVERLATLIENQKLVGKISDELESEILETMTSAMVASVAENKRDTLRRFETNQEIENELSRHRNVEIKKKKKSKADQDQMDKKDEPINAM